MNPMKKKIIFTILAIIFFLGSVTFYINTVAIPKYLKNIIIQDTQEFLGRKIVLQDLHFNPLKGFVLNGITVFEANSPDAFATVVNANINFLYWPFLRERKIVLSSVELNAVALNLIHYAGDQWNFSDIVERRLKNKRQQSLKVYVSRLTLTDSRIKLTNLEDGSQFSDVFDHTDAGISFSFSKGLAFHGSTFIADKNGLLNIEGTYSPSKNKFSADIKLKNFLLNNYLRLFSLQMPFLFDDINVDDIAIKMTLANHLATVEGDIALSHLSLHTESQSLKTESLLLNQINFAFNDGEINLKGAVAAHGVKAASLEQSYGADEIGIQIDALTAHGKTFDFSGTCKTNGTTIAIPQQLALSGDLNFNGVHLSQGADILSVDAQAEFKNSSMTVHDNIHMKGDFVSPGFSFIKTPQAVKANGNLAVTNLIYQWPEDKKLSGQITLSDIRVNGKPGSQWTAQSNLHGQGVQIKLPNEKILTTDLIGSGMMQYLTQAKTFQIKSSYQLSNAVFKISSAMTLTGNPSGSVSVSSKTDPLKPLPYTGQMEFKDGALKGTKIGAIENIIGAVSFENNLLQTSGLDFLTLGMPASLKGTLENFASPSLNVKVHINDFDLAATQEIIPEIIHKNQLTLQGTAPSLDISYQGPIDTTESSDIRFSAELKDSVIISGTLNKTASNISGNISYAEKILSWKNLNAEFNATAYKLTGNINPSLNPTIDTTIENDNLKLNTRFTYSPETVTFERLTGRYKNALFDATGTTKSSSDGIPTLNFTGEAEFDLKDLPALFPSVTESIKNFRLAGKTTIKGQFTGDTIHWQDWQFNLTGSSPKLSIWGLNLANINFNAVQRNNLLKPFHLWGDFYGGELNFVASVDTAQKILPLELVVRILNSDLKKLQADTPFKKQSLAGILSATAIIDGAMTDLSKLNGKGGVEIKDGLLWEFDLLKGLGGILLIPEYKDIVFTQAGMNFFLKDGVMTTENIDLVGPSLNLFGKGTLDFNQGQALNLWLSPDFNSAVISNSSSLKKGTTAIITQTEKFMSVNVTGTLSKPQYKVNKSPVKILQKTGGVILENVSQFFQNIF